MSEEISDETFQFSNNDQILIKQSYQTKLHVEIDCVSLCKYKQQLIQFPNFSRYLYKIQKGRCTMSLKETYWKYQHHLQK